MKVGAASLSLQPLLGGTGLTQDVFGFLRLGGRPAGVSAGLVEALARRLDGTLGGPPSVLRRRQVGGGLFGGLGRVVGAVARSLIAGFRSAGGSRRGLDLSGARPVTTRGRALCLPARR